MAFVRLVRLLDSCPNRTDLQAFAALSLRDDADTFLFCFDKHGHNKVWRSYILI
jgi:hypothetical protein